MKYIAIDTETYDPYLKTKGPGDIRKDGLLIGFSMSTQDSKNKDFDTQYIPLYSQGIKVANHNSNITKIKDICGDSNCTYIGANIAYDLGWLATIGVQVKGRKKDIQIRESLLNEHLPSYSLAALAENYKIMGKSDDGLIEWCLNNNIDPNKAKEHMIDMHWLDIEAYAQQDAELTYRIYSLQEELIKKEELEDVDRLESDLIDVLFAMRQKGIPVNLEEAERITRLLYAEMETARVQLAYTDIWSNYSIARLCDDNDIRYPITAKGNPSFTAEWLEKQTHPLLKQLLRIRKIDRLGGVFIQSKIIDMAINGRIHPRFKQTRTEEGGTKTGRLSSAMPNMQQIPARNEELSSLVRSIFYADPGYTFGVFDYSQQEPRILTHYALKMGFPMAKDVAEQYRINPKADYHQITTNLVNKITHRDFSRKIIKPINLALSYGMGKQKLADTLQIPVKEAISILNSYHEALPYVSRLTQVCSNLMKKRGWVRTHLGRKIRLGSEGKEYKALNGIIQGSAADMTKTALVKLYQAGYIPYCTVHDEIDTPLEEGNLNQVTEIQNIMLTAMPLSIPMQIDIEIGKTWGGVKEMNLC